METNTITLDSWKYRERKTYLAAIILAAGNIALPQLFHMVSQGGTTWLPIYFFTLVGAYRYGWRVGMLTAIASPLANHALFGMPVAAMLPVVVMKSALLAMLASIAAARFGRATIPLLVAVVAGYQALGMLGEWAITGSLHTAWHAVATGLPGMLLQVVGGRAVLGFMARH